MEVAGVFGILLTQQGFSAVQLLLILSMYFYLDQMVRCTEHEIVVKHGQNLILRLEAHFSKWLLLIMESGLV